MRIWSMAPKTAVLAAMPSVRMATTAIE